MSEQHQTLVRYDAMCVAIAECLKVDEVKGIHDLAKAHEEYFRQAQNREAERQCAEIRIRAEHKAGRILKQLNRAQGKRTDRLPAPEATSSPEETKSFAEQLDEHGITRKQAENWQRLADVSQDQLDQSLARPGVVPTTGGIISDAFPKETTIEATTPSQWFCNWLLGFEEEGLLDVEPTALLSDMTAAQRDKVQRLAPSVSDWLWQLQPAPDPANAA